MEFTVYRLIAPNGVSYIGLTCQFIKRLRWHNAMSKWQHGVCRLHPAIKAFGWHQFRLEILARTNNLEIGRAMERAAIARYREEGGVYNRTNGGESPLCKWWKEN